ncbi:MAG: LysR family transcriptional regulator [Actinomycetota bacterium]
MNLRRLTYFITVVEEGSISLAAKRLHMTQPPVSQAIIALEREVGAALLHRLPRGVEPTPAGELLVQQGRNLLRWSNRITEQVSRLGAGEDGRLNIASVPPFAWSHLPTLLQDFGAMAPGVEVQLADPDPAGVLTMVSDGRADIGFVITTDPDTVAAAYPNLLINSLAQLPLRLAVARPSALPAYGRPAHYQEAKSARIADYAQTTWFLPNVVRGFPGLAEVAEGLWRSAGFRPNAIQVVSTLHTALPLIVAGMGVTLLPGSRTGPIFPGISALEVDLAMPPLFATAVRSRHIDPLPALERFLAVVSEHFPS